MVQSRHGAKKYRRVSADFFCFILIPKAVSNNFLLTTMFTDFKNVRFSLVSVLPIDCEIKLHADVQSIMTEALIYFSSPLIWSVINRR